MDFIESGKLATDAVKFFVLDEADRLLDTGTQELVMKLFSKLPKAATGTQRLQVCLPFFPSSCLWCWWLTADHQHKGAQLQALV